MVMFVLEQALGFHWYWALLLGALAYLLARYVAYFIAERKLIATSFDLRRAGADYTKKRP
jgi:hypothetical protein